MISSFMMYLCPVILLAFGVFFIIMTKLFADEKKWSEVIAFGLTSVLFSVLSGAMLIGAYFIYVAEHALK